MKTWQSFPRALQIFAYIFQDQWFIGRKKHITNFAQMNKGEHSYLTHVAWFKQSHYNTTQSWKLTKAPK